MNLTNSLTTNFFKPVVLNQKSEEDEKEQTNLLKGIEPDIILQKRFEDSPNVIKDLIVSYLDADSTIHQFGAVVDQIDNAKAFIFTGHWSKKDDLKLIGLNIIYEILKVFNKSNESTLKNYKSVMDLDIGKLTKDQIKEFNLYQQAKSNKSLMEKYYFDRPSQIKTIESCVEIFSNFDFANELRKLASNFQTLKSAIIKNVKIMEYASNGLKDNQEIMVEAIKQQPMLVSLASDRLKKDRDFALVTVKIDGFCLTILNPKFLSDLELVSEALETYGGIFTKLDKSLKNDKKLALKAVKNNGLLLKDLNDELRQDLEIVLTAVTQNGKALRFVPPALKNNHSIILAAMTNISNPADLIPAPFFEERDIAIASVRNNGLFLEKLKKEFKADPEVVLTAVMNDPSAIKFANRNLWGNKEIMLAVVSGDGNLLSHAIFASTKSKLNDDFDVVLAAVTCDALGSENLALESASPGLQNDRRIVLAAVHVNPDAIKFASVVLQKDPEILQAAEEARKYPKILIQERPTKQRDL